jgi:hypothetical protein
MSRSLELSGYHKRLGAAKGGGCSIPFERRAIGARLRLARR